MVDNALLTPEQINDYLDRILTEADAKTAQDLVGRFVWDYPRIDGNGFDAILAKVSGYFANYQGEDPESAIMLLFNLPPHYLSQIEEMLLSPRLDSFLLLNAIQLCAHALRDELVEGRWLHGEMIGWFALMKKLVSKFFEYNGEGVEVNVGGYLGEALAIANQIVSLGSVTLAGVLTPSEAAKDLLVSIPHWAYERIHEAYPSATIHRNLRDWSATRDGGSDG